MKVSVIVPAYNAENFIKDSLNSIIHQVYKDLEIIVIDDASTDNTRNIINEYAKKDKRVVPFYQNTNEGVSAASAAKSRAESYSAGGGGFSSGGGGGGSFGGGGSAGGR